MINWALSPCTMVYADTLNIQPKFSTLIWSPGQGRLGGTHWTFYFSISIIISVIYLYNFNLECNDIHTVNVSFICFSLNYLIKLRHNIIYIIYFQCWCGKDWNVHCVKSSEQSNHGNERNQCRRGYWQNANQKTGDGPNSGEVNNRDAFA